MEKAVCGGSEAENVDVEMEEAGKEGRAEAPPPPPTPPRRRRWCHCWNPCYCHSAILAGQPWRG